MSRHLLEGINCAVLEELICNVRFLFKAPVFPFQRIRSTVDEKEQKQLLMDLDVVMRSSDCKYIVKFYGALFTEVYAMRNIFSLDILSVYSLALLFKSKM